VQNGRQLTSMECGRLNDRPNVYWRP
jgi:hypothetical protein